MVAIGASPPVNENTRGQNEESRTLCSYCLFFSFSWLLYVADMERFWLEELNTLTFRYVLTSVHHHVKTGTILFIAPVSLVTGCRVGSVATGFFQ